MALTGPSLVIEQQIIHGLLTDDVFLRKAIPHLKDDHFTDDGARTVFKVAREHISEYNSPPSREALLIAVDSVPGLRQQSLEHAVAVVDTVTSSAFVPSNRDWLVKTAEKYVQDRALYNALLECVSIVDDPRSKKSKGSIPQILTDALAVSFDTNVGHDYINAAEDRYRYYHRVEERVAFDIDILNDITKGGLPKKTLTVIQAGTNVGKSLIMCHMAAACLKQGLNVLYITLEMAEEGIAERIDANLLDVSTDDLHAMPRDLYMKKVEKLKMQNPGRLIIKEYPTTTAGALHFRHLISELKLKKKFDADIIFIDYLNLCQSARLPASAAQNSYGYVKSIAEELRGLAGEFNLPLVTATQTNRSGFANSDFGLEDTSESFGVPMTADFTLGVVSTEELEKLGLYQCKVLKLRFGSKRHKRRFVIGVNYDRMRLHNVDDAEQDAVANEPDEGNDDTPKFRGRKKTANKVRSNDFKF